MGKIYIVNENGHTTEMEAIYCSNEAAELQQLLENNLDLLPGDQINPESPRKWLHVKREMPVEDPNTGEGRWSIDLFVVDQSGIPTFIECKRFLDTRSRREVVGQMLDYAANGQYYFDKELIREYLSNIAGERGIDIEQLVGTIEPESGDSVDNFLDLIENNLREGQIRLIFFMEEAPMELKSIVEFLNKQMERSEILIVEAKQYQKDKLRIVVPSVFGYTEQARRIKKSVTTTKTYSRKKWNYDLFFEDVRTKTHKEVAVTLQEVYQCCKEQGFILRWGTGKDTGSYSAILSHISTKSLMSAYSDGKLAFNFGWLNDDERVIQLRNTFFEKLKQEAGFDFPHDALQKNPSFEYQAWQDKVAMIAKILKNIPQQFQDNLT